MEHRCDLRINAAVEQEAVLLVLQRSTTRSHRYARAQQAASLHRRVVWLQAIIGARHGGCMHNPSIDHRHTIGSQRTLFSPPLPW
jgi:hypothetical protein